MIRGEEYEYRRISDDTVSIERGRDTLGTFKRLDHAYDPFAEQDAILLRRFRYYARQIDPMDSVSLQSLGYDFWALLNRGFHNPDTETIQIQKAGD